MLQELENYVENVNTKGAGKRFRGRFVTKIKSSLATTNHALCNHLSLAKFNLRCFFINDWVLAYEVSNNAIVIRTIIHGSLLA